MFAAVEALLDPSLAGRPVIVGAAPGTRGVVATCSYEARAYGVHSAMPIFEARNRCPHAAFLPVRHSVYREYSRRVFAVISEHAEKIQPVSIDEAFADLSLAADPAALAREIKERIRSEIGLVASVGLASNKLVAKIATDAGKPDGFILVPHGEEAAFLAPFPVRRLWGVGPKTAERLEEAAIQTVGELAAAEVAALVPIAGRHYARKLHEHALGIDDSPVETDREVQSISDEVTFQRDEANRKVLWGVLREQAAACSRHLKEQGLLARTVTVKLRYSDFHTITRGLTLAIPTDEPEPFAEAAAALMRQHWAPDPRPLRLLGLRVSRLEAPTGLRQLPLLSSRSPPA